MAAGNVVLGAPARFLAGVVCILKEPDSIGGKVGKCVDIRQKIEQYASLLTRGSMSCAVIRMLKDEGERGSTTDFIFCYMNNAFAALLGFPKDLLMRPRLLFPVSRGGSEMANIF